MSRSDRIHRVYFRITRFEFWPFWLFYLPMYFYGLCLAIRSGSFTYFTAANPVMKYGGAFGTSKFDVLQRIGGGLVPSAILINGDEGEEGLIEELDGAGISFPLIAKPDVGERGKGVELIQDPEELMKYLPQIRGEIILQEYISLPHELGILYYRYPDGTGEGISSVVIRDFLSVTGDGSKTLKELINEKMRAAKHRKYLYRKHSARLEEVPRHEETILLEPIGNHCRGTRFLNGNHLINQDLLKTISGIAMRIEGFDYGRFDLKVEELENLDKGEGILILELNGCNSEPAHIYDPGYRIFQAYRDIARHMRIIFKISRCNHRNGTPYASFGRFYSDLLIHISSGISK
ncbi:hypothetical protein ACFLTA_05430 [Bacteroidota bacterium]